MDRFDIVKLMYMHTSNRIFCPHTPQTFYTYEFFVPITVLHAADLDSSVVCTKNPRSKQLSNAGRQSTRMSQRAQSTVPTVQYVNLARRENAQTATAKFKSSE